MMVNKIVLSDIFEEKERNLKEYWEGRDVEIYSWSGSAPPRLSDYGVVILDMNIPLENHYRKRFVTLRREIQKLIDAGGVIICLNYYTRVTPHALARDENETNYDWLDKFNEDLIDRGAKPGKNIEIISKEKLFKKYFEGVTEYHKTIAADITSLREYLFKFYTWEEDIVSDLFHKKFYRYDGVVIAVNKVTMEPIACVINYGKGNLIFLPQSNYIEFASGEVLENLCEIGEKYYEINQESIGIPLEIPNWIAEYITRQEKDLEKQIELQENQLKLTKQKKIIFEEVDVLLYGYGKPLENIVQKIFGEEFFN